MENISSSKSSSVKSKEILRSLRAVSDETRIRILGILSFASFNVNEIMEVLEMGQSRVSRHLKILSDAGFLSSHREGTWVYYSLSKDGVEFSTDLAELILSYREDLSFRESDQRKVSLLLKTREDKSAKFFNKVGKNWDRIQEEVLNPSIYRNKILSYLPAKSSHILDLGCGPGSSIPYLLKRAKKVTGVDTSRKMLESAIQSYGNSKSVQFIESPLESLSFPSASMDAVVASMVLHHVSNPPLAIAEAFRVLKPGGTFCVADLKKHDKEFMRDNYADLWLGFDNELLITWLSQAGFEIKDQDELDTYSYFKILTIKALKKGGRNVHTNNSKR